MKCFFLLSLTLMVGACSSSGTPTDGSDLLTDTSCVDVPDGHQEIVADAPLQDGDLTPDVPDYNSTCPDGMTLLEDGGCINPVLPNCEPDAPGSILLECEEQLRDCEADAENASCTTCLDWTVEDDGDCLALNCIAGSPANIAPQCADANRVCDPAGLEGKAAACGDCLAWFVEVEGTCTPVVTCEERNCAENHRFCLPATIHEDSQCTSCLPGYLEDGEGCATDPDAVCQPDVNGSIATICLEANRSCEDGESGAICGSCLEGYYEFDASGECEAVVPCADLDCEEQSRACSETPVPHCDGCLEGYSADPITGDCQPLPTCQSLQCADQGLTCMPATQSSEAYCFQGCPSGQALHGSTCVPCASSCDGEGETGVLWPIASQSGKCVCQTEDGWFYTEGIDIGTYPCDVDQDGWVAESARLSVESDDPAVASNARCHVRRFDSIELVNEAGEIQSVPLSLASPAYQGSYLALYEPDHLDDDGLQQWIDLPPLGNRKLLPEELNPLTKYCADADYNGNGLKDFAEWQNPQGEVPNNPNLAPFMAIAYFGELYRGWYSPATAGSAYGVYHIVEKSRFPEAPESERVFIGYDTDYELDHGALNENKVALMQKCLVWPDPAFDPESGFPAINQDFARFGPESPSMDFAHTVETEPGVPQVVPHNSWDGLNHHSQYRCIQIVNSPPEDPALEPNKLTRDDFTDSYGLRFQFNSCSALEQFGDALSFGPNSTPGSSQPQMLCTPQDIDSVEGGTVGWAAVRFRTGAPYEGGCVDQCAVSSRCGLCTKGVFKAQGGALCGLETSSAGYAGIPKKCEDIAHPEGVDWEGYLCDDCPWQEECDDGDDCTVNLCHSDVQCVTAIPTPDTFPCPDDGNPCTSDSCQAGVCEHFKVADETPCPGDGNECKTWTCGAQTHGVCGWTADSNKDCTLNPDNDCLRPKCNNSGECGIPKNEGVECSMEDDGNQCTTPQCDGAGACQHAYVGDGVACSLDDNECTHDVCTDDITGMGPTCWGDTTTFEGDDCTQGVPLTCNASTCHQGYCLAKSTTCVPDEQETCNICGTRYCADDCQWSECMNWEDDLDSYDYPIGHANEAKLSATDLQPGGYNDNPNPGPMAFTANLIPEDDVDWYTFKINDTGADGDPMVEFAFIPAPCQCTYSVYAELACVNNLAVKESQSWTVQTVPAVYEFHNSCDGTADDDMIFTFRVKYTSTSSEYSCASYHISYEIR